MVKASGPVRFLVTGSRNWNEDWIIWEALDEYLSIPDLLIVHGQCPTGADLFASQWCEEKGIKQEKHPIVQECVYHGLKHSLFTMGRSAGPIRNRMMVEMGAVLCLAFPRGESPGTRGTIKLAKAAGIPVITEEGVL